MDSRCKEHPEFAENDCPKCWVRSKVIKWDAEEKSRYDNAKKKALERHKEKPFKTLREAYQFIETQMGGD